MKESNIKLSRKSLLTWFRKNQRDLPWRRNLSFYRTLVAEFMLQQTRIDQARAYYLRFLKKFPTIKHLARAKLETVFKQWEGLGYYRRAEHLHRTAKFLAKMRKISPADLEHCPGIGPYTLAAISSIVWKVKLPVLDGNVKRVVSRLLALEATPESQEGKARITSFLNQGIDPRSPGDWNQAMMEVGATLCTPFNPKCISCPLRRFCQAYKLGRQEDFPFKTAKPFRPHKRFLTAVIFREDNRVLIAKRPEKGLLAHLWEFPSAEKKKSKETSEGCLVKVLKEKLALRVAIEEMIAKIDHAYTHFSITVQAYRCRFLGGQGKANGYQKLKWVRPHELHKFPFHRAHGRIKEHLLGTLKKPC